MLELLKELCGFNSHTFNPAGVNRAGEIAGRELARLGLCVETLEVAPARVADRHRGFVERPLGRAVRAVWGPGADAGRVLLCIHLDTVHLPESNFTLRDQGPRIVGPGVVDAKGGLVVLLEGLRRYLAGGADKGVEVLLVPDEEIGSVSSADLLRESAWRCVAGLVYEPAFPDGALVGARKGSGNYSVVVRGREAHAGRDFTSGRNAVLAAARAALDIDALSAAFPGATVNVGVLEGGSAGNVVPGLAVLRVNVRIDRRDDGPRLDAALRDCLARTLPAIGGISYDVVGGIFSPPRTVEASAWLFDVVRDCAAGMGISPRFRDSGGTCDGNKLADVGLAVVDSLGPVGGELHTDREYVEVASLEERAELTARILRSIPPAPPGHPPCPRQTAGPGAAGAAVSYTRLRS